MSKSNKTSEKKRKQSSKRKHDDTMPVRNEGIEPTWAYQPPDGAAQADYDVEFGSFGYDQVKADDEAELWIVRVPAGVRHLCPYASAML
jgi:hypothetical protein